jgi:hypothetical protein
MKGAVKILATGATPMSVFHRAGLARLAHKPSMAAYRKSIFGF